MIRSTFAYRVSYFILPLLFTTNKWIDFAKWITFIINPKTKYYTNILYFHSKIIWILWNFHREISRNNNKKEKGMIISMIVKRIPDITPTLRITAQIVTVHFLCLRNGNLYAYILSAISKSTLGSVTLRRSRAVRKNGYAMAKRLLYDGMAIQHSRIGACETSLNQIRCRSARIY